MLACGGGDVRARTALKQMKLTDCTIEYTRLAHVGKLCPHVPAHVLLIIYCRAQGSLSNEALQNVGASSTTAAAGMFCLGRQQTGPGSHDSIKPHKPSSRADVSWHGREVHAAQPIKEPGGGKFIGCGLQSPEKPRGTRTARSPGDMFGTLEYSGAGLLGGVCARARDLAGVGIRFLTS